MAVSPGERGSHRLASCGAAWKHGACPCGLTRPNPSGARFRLCPNRTTSPGNLALNVSERRGQVNFRRNPPSRWGASQRVALGKPHSSKLYAAPSVVLSNRPARDCPAPQRLGDSLSTSLGQPGHVFRDRPAVTENARAEQFGMAEQASFRLSVDRPVSLAERMARRRDLYTKLHLAG